VASTRQVFLPGLLLHKLLAQRFVASFPGMAREQNDR
jgi:hypothetical protein